MKYRAVSLFDLDHTLLKENSSYKFGAYLYKQKIISFSSMLYFVGCYGLHKAGKLSLQALHQQIFIKLFKNHSLIQFQKYSHAFLDEIFDSILYYPALEKLNEAKRMGHLTVILSSSPDFLVKLLAERFGVDRWAGTAYLTDSQKKLTALSEILDGAGKAKFLIALSKEMGIPIAEMTAYSDSFLDLPFLKEAGRAVGVNPDNRLRKLCNQYQWDII